MATHFRFLFFVSLFFLAGSFLASCDSSTKKELCGNGTLDDREICDGTNLKEATCQTEGFLSGTLSCTENCTLDTAGCSLICGNDTLDEGETCDGTNLGEVTCEDLGFLAGDLSCSDTCILDTFMCIPLTCGNEIVDEGEICVTAGTWQRPPARAWGSCRGPSPVE